MHKPAAGRGPASGLGKLGQGIGDQLPTLDESSMEGLVLDDSRDDDPTRRLLISAGNRWTDSSSAAARHHIDPVIPLQVVVGSGHILPRDSSLPIPGQVDTRKAKAVSQISAGDDGSPYFKQNFVTTLDIAEGADDDMTIIKPHQRPSKVARIASNAHSFASAATSVAQRHSVGGLVISGDDDAGLARFRRQEWTQQVSCRAATIGAAYVFSTCMELRDEGPNTHDRTN